MDDALAIPFRTLQSALRWHVNWANQHPDVSSQCADGSLQRGDLFVAIQKWFEDEVADVPWNAVFVFLTSERWEIERRPELAPIPRLLAERDSPAKIASFCDMIYRRFPHIVHEWEPASPMTTALIPTTKSSRLSSMSAQFRLIPVKMAEAKRERRMNSAGEAASTAGRLLAHVIDAGAFADRPDLTLAFTDRMENEDEYRRHGRAYCEFAKLLLGRPKGQCSELVEDGCAVIADAIARFMESHTVARPTVDSTGALLQALDRFDAVLRSTTSVAADGVRTIGPAPHAITLSQATVALHKAIGEAMSMALTIDDQSLFGALVEASEATGWSPDRHNRAQTGDWPHRWEPGETIAADMLSAIEKARTLAGDFPLRSGYHTPATAEVLDAVRKVGDWDGSNWAAVRAVLEHAGQSLERIDAMTLEDVRQYFAVGQRRIITALGGQPFTATHTIVSYGEPTATSLESTKQLKAAATALPAIMESHKTGGKATKSDVEKAFAQQLLNEEQRERLAMMSDRQLADHFNTHAKTIRRTKAFTVLQQYRGPAHHGRTIANPGSEYVTSSDAPARKGYQRQREKH